MKSCIIYYSKTGNTKKIVSLLTEALGRKEIPCEEIEIKAVKDPGFMRAGYASWRQTSLPIKNNPTDCAEYDLIIAGVPIWNGKPSPYIKTFLEKVQHLKGKKGAFFMTCGGSTDDNEKAVLTFTEIWESHGITLCGEPLLVQMDKGAIQNGEQTLHRFVEQITG
jgi:flavodoxin